MTRQELSNRLIEWLDAEDPQHFWFIHALSAGHDDYDHRAREIHAVLLSHKRTMTGPYEMSPEAKQDLDEVLAALDTYILVRNI